MFAVSEVRNVFILEVIPVSVICLVYLIRPSLCQNNCLCFEQFAGDLGVPLSLVPTRDGTKRLFVSEMSGKVHVFFGGSVSDVKGDFSTVPSGVPPGVKWRGAKLKNLLMDLRDTTEASKMPKAGDENGMLGMILHPRFPEDPRIFLSYTVGSNSSTVLKVAQVNVSPNDPNRVDRASLKTIMSIAQHDDNKNGGELLFRDGLLYIFTGDGGATSGDLAMEAQLTTSLLGKVLRINTDDDQSYSIPADNPFVGTPGAKEIIYALGFRHFFGCGDGPKGELFCADVSEDRWEEINDIKKGQNYGWPLREGMDCRKGYKCNNIVNEELPLYNYTFNPARAVVGGTTYRGCRIPFLNGTYIFGDFMTTDLYGLRDDGGKYSHQTLDTCSKTLCEEKGFVDELPPIVSIRADEEGEMYILTVDLGQKGVVPGSGQIFKVTTPERADEDKCEKEQTSLLTIEGVVEISDRYHTTSGVSDTTSSRKNCLVASLLLGLRLLM